MTKSYKKFSLLTFLLLGLSPVSFAADLMEVYQQAVNNDLTFQAARADRLSKREALPQSLAGVLPNLGLTANSVGNKVYINVPASGIESKAKFNSHGYLLTLSQPLFNFASWVTIRQASATVKQADAQYAAAAQDLILRTANAYFAVLQAKDDLRYIQAQKKAIARQLDQAKQRYNVGMEAITTVYNAQASYDSIVAQELAAENTLTNSRESLREMTGLYYPELSSLTKNFPLLTPVPNNIDEWVTTATKQNLTLLATRYSVDATRENIKINFAGHLPTVSAVGTHQRGSNLTAVPIGANNLQSDTDSQIDTIGVQISMPLFEGGLVTSQTRQAQYDYQKASAELEKAYRDTIISTRESFNDIITGISKIKADKQAIVSNQSSLTSTEESFKVGTRTIVDVLLAQQNLLQAQRNYSQDQYSYILDIIKLKLLAGTLNETDLQQINGWLTTIAAESTADAAISNSDKNSTHVPVTSKASIKKTHTAARKTTPHIKTVKHPVVKSKLNHRVA